MTSMDSGKEYDELIGRLNALPTDADSGTDGWPDLVYRLKSGERT